MAYTITRTNYLELNSIPLSTPAWWITNLETEIVKRVTRGANPIVFGASGRRRRRRYLDECVFQFEMRIRGLVKWDGTAHSNASDGFVANANELNANLGYGSATVVPAVWHRRDTSTKSANVDLVHFECSDLNKRDAKAVLEIVAPAGLFA